MRIKSSVAFPTGLVNHLLGIGKTMNHRGDLLLPFGLIHRMHMIVSWHNFLHEQSPYMAGREILKLFPSEIKNYFFIRNVTGFKKNAKNESMFM